MKKHVLFIHGAGRGSYREDGLLVASLRKALGPAYTVRYPKMVNEEDPTYKEWKAQIASELARLDGDVTLVGHSVGGSVLLKYLSEARIENVAGLFLIAAPHWGGDEFWSWDEVTLPRNVAAKLEKIPRVFCTTAATIQSCHLPTLGSTQQKSLKQPSVQSMGVGINLAMTWLMSPLR